MFIYTVRIRRRREKSLNHKQMPESLLQYKTSYALEPLYYPRALDTGTCTDQSAVTWPAVFRGPTRLSVERWYGNKLKVNGPERPTLWKGRNSWQWAKHAWLYSDLPQTLKGRNICQPWVLNSGDLNFCISHCCRARKQKKVLTTSTPKSSRD